MEVVDDQQVKGRLLALQIKSGKSWFSEPAPSGWWFRPDKQHVQYWTNHSLPVLIVLYSPENQQCHWQLVNDQTLERTSAGGWKICVPEHQVLQQGFADTLAAATQGEPYMLRLRELRLAMPWMQLLADGERLVIDIEEWVNKSSGRGLISLGVDREDGSAPDALADWTILVRGPRYETQLPSLFPWATLSLHYETYEDADRDAYELDCLRVDGEGDRIFTQSYKDWCSEHISDGLRPYTIKGDEVAQWRLELFLNDLGKAFLRVDEYGRGEGMPLVAN